MTTRYDMIRACESCEGLRQDLKEAQAKIEKLEATLAEVPKNQGLDFSKGFPYQADAKAKCLICTALLTKVQSNGALVRKSINDDRFCAGRPWWQFWEKKCLKLAHIHRHCAYCDATWCEVPLTSSAG